MTESPRHRNSNARIQKILPTLGAEVLINTQDGGKNGYAFPPVVCPDNKVRRFIIDTLARMPGGLMAAFEVEFNHPSTRVKQWFLRQCGIVFVPVTPALVDLWVKDPSMIPAEVEFRFKEQFGKKVVLEVS